MIMALPVLGGTAHARNTILDQFNARYGTAGTRLNTCNTCHTSSYGFNPYGTALRSSGIDFAAIEGADSDGDTFSNIAEINARTFPGDPNDKPAPSDTMPPTVSTTNPLRNATGVSVTAAVTATFSEAVTASTVTTATFTLSGGGGSVAGAVSLSGTTATFRPASALSYNTTYTATVTTGVRDLAGNAMAANYAWTFTTGTAPDTTPPTVTSTNPANNQTGVSVNTAVTAAFSEAVTASTVNTATFTLSGGGGAVSGTVSLSGTTATFRPASSLLYNTAYTATLTTGVRDASGNAMAANHIWTFTTGTAPDATAPAVSVTSPIRGATDVPVSTAVTATFSEAVTASTVTTATFTLSGGGGSVAGAVSLSGTTATFRPASALSYNTTYTATVTTGVRDLAGNAMAANYAWTFTTGTAPDTTPPTVTSTMPAGGATGVPVNSTITATFSESVDPATVSGATFALSGGVSGAVTISGRTATFTPSAALSYNTTYTATVTTGVRDLAGNAMAANHAWTFTTSAASDTTPPTVTSTMPAGGATGVPVNSVVSATFGERLDASTVNAATFQLKTGAGQPVVGTATAGGTTATFTPSGSLGGGVTYTATLTTGIKDPAGNALASAYSWSFTTAASGGGDDSDDDDSDDDGVEDDYDDYPDDDRKATPPSCKRKDRKIKVDTSANAGTRLRDVASISDDAADVNQTGKPSGYEFRDGLLAYRVEGVAEGGTIRMTLSYPEPFPAGSKVFMTDSSGFHEVAGAVIDGNVVTVSLTDGGMGDRDLRADTMILDPVGVATPAEAAGGSGGGCGIAGSGGGWTDGAAAFGSLFLIVLGLAARRVLLAALGRATRGILALRRR